MSSSKLDIINNEDDGWRTVSSSDVRLRHRIIDKGCQSEVYPVKKVFHKMQNWNTCRNPSVWDERKPDRKNKGFPESSAYGFYSRLQLRLSKEKCDFECLLFAEVIHSFGLLKAGFISVIHKAWTLLNSPNRNWMNFPKKYWSNCFLVCRKT